MNKSKLRGVMAERGITYDDLARGLRINRSTLFRKLRRGDDGITIADILSMKQILSLATEEVRLIFFP